MLHVGSVGGRRRGPRAAALLAAALAAAATAQDGGRWCDLLPRPGAGSLERLPLADDWFQVYRVAKNVYAILEPHQFQEVISYLIVGSEGAILFDTGMGIGRIRPVVEKLTDRPVRVVNSHTHFDHVGGNAEFDAVLGMDMRYTRRSAAGRNHDEVKEEVSAGALCRALPDGVDAGSYRIRPFKISAFLKDGEVLELGDRRLEVLAIPGHTPDSLALLDRDAGLLWTGDTYYEGPIWLFAPETDLRAYEKSVRRLARLAPQLQHLMTAHQTPVAEPRRLTQLQGALESVRSGSVVPRALDGDLVDYGFDGFSLTMRHRARTVQRAEAPASEPD